MCEFFTGKNIFITGGTGFMGKVLLEKILTSFPDVGRVYILVRGKKSVTFHQRLEELRKEPIFTKYNRVDVKQFSKIVCVEGHIGDHGLEISERDRQMLIEQVNVVFHAASTIRFEEPLDVAMKSIFIGTKTMLSLANDMRHLSSFTYVSTAFLNSKLLTTNEMIYDMKIDGDSILSLYENNSKEEVEKLVRNSYFDGRVNTYCFAKSLTEDYIRRNYNHLPIAIVRPSAVTASLFEPEPGYCDSPSALSFTLIFQGLGISRYLPFKGAALLDIIPVDIAVNSMLIVAREIGMQEEHATSTVYNVTSAWHWPISNKQIAESELKALRRSPPVTAVRTVSRLTETTRFEQNVIKYFSELPFAIVSDIVAKIRGHKSRTLKLTKWIQSVRDEQAYFVQKSWFFPRQNMDKAVARLSDEDRKLFPALPIVKDNDEYFYNYWMSLRELVIGEKADNIDAAHRHQKRLAFRSLALSCAAATCVCVMAGSLYF